MRRKSKLIQIEWTIKEEKDKKITLVEVIKNDFSIKEVKESITLDKT